MELQCNMLLRLTQASLQLTQYQTELAGGKGRGGGGGGARLRCTLVIMIRGTPAVNDSLLEREVMLHMLLRFFLLFLFPCPEAP